MAVAKLPEDISPIAGEVLWVTEASEEIGARVVLGESTPEVRLRNLGMALFSLLKTPALLTRKSSVYAPTQTANLDGRLLDGSEEAVVKSLRDIDPDEGEQAFRPDFGVLGKPIHLRANFFPMNVPERPLYEYDVKISPDLKVRQVRRRIFQLLEKTPDWLQHGLVNSVAHDHSKKLISTNKLVQPLAIKVPYPEESEPKVREGPKPGGRLVKRRRRLRSTLSQSNLSKLSIPKRYRSGSIFVLPYDVSSHGPIL